MLNTQNQQVKIETNVPITKDKNKKSKRKKDHVLKQKSETNTLHLPTRKLLFPSQKGEQSKHINC